MDTAAALADRFSHGELRVSHRQNLVLPWVREADLAELFQAARAAGFATANAGLLTDLVFNNVLYVLCKKDSSRNSIDIALSIFHRIQDPDKYSYSNVIIGLCKFGRLESAFEVFNEMGRANLVPTRSAANVLVGKLCEMASNSQMVEKVRVTDVRRPFDILVPNVTAKCSVEPAFKVFWAVLKLGVMPSAHVVNGLILELCKVGKFEEAVEIVKVVENRKLRCIDESYYIMVKALCDVHRVNEACDLFERMVFLGLRPKTSVYNSIIRAYCKFGNVDEAGKYFRIMNKRRCEPDCATYTMLIHAHCSIQNWETAHELLIEMIELGWHPHLDTYNLVNGLLNKNGRPDLSLKLERKMEIQNVCAHCKAGRLEAACDQLNSMLAKGFHLPVYARDAIQRAFRKSGKWKIARELLEKMGQTAMDNDVQA
nr:pentatricopeptide repeat protein AaPPR1223 [Agave angustifolia]